MLVYMGYLKGLSDRFKGSLIIVKLNLFVFSELTKITVKEPNDFFFPGAQTTTCEIYESLLLKPHI